MAETICFRNRRYHTMKYTPDTLGYKRMAMVVQGVYAAVLDAAKP